MTTLLHIDSSPSLVSSISRALSSEFVRQWTACHADGQIIRRDLADGVIPPIDAAWIEAAFKPAAARTEEQRDKLTLSDTLVQELIQADEYIIGTPMHNFSVPAALKLWIDQVVRLGETYGRNGNERFGLLSGKKATIFVASGGQYQQGTATEQFDFVTNYLKTILGYMGVQDIKFHAAGGTASLLHGNITRDEFLQPHLNAISLEMR
jgi:FMN-dependent NADH-azoreductase